MMKDSQNTARMGDSHHTARIRDSQDEGQSG